MKRWLPVVLLCTFIFVSSSFPGAKFSEVKSVDIFVHKTAHLALFFMLTVTFYRAVKSVGLSVGLTILYGISDEIHQQFVPTRSGVIADVVVDAVAALLAGLVLWKFYQNLPYKLKNWLEE